MKTKMHLSVLQTKQKNKKAKAKQMQPKQEVGRLDVPCRDDVRKLRCVGGDLYCDWLKEHELLIDTDGVGTSCHVLQPERTIFLADDCEDRTAKQNTV